MHYPDVIHAFGFRLDPGQTPQSLSTSAPVFRLRNAHGDWILKRTQKPLARSQAIAHWTTSLAAQGLRVVTPAAGFGDNPRLFVDAEGQESVWVVYPFIAGATYQGDARQIQAAGEMLGKIHAAGSSTVFGLILRETIESIDAGEVAGDIVAILQRVHQHFPAFVDRAERVLQERTQRYFDDARPRLLATQLPQANCTWDFKAVNLVYETPTALVLIDPDNGGRIPRTYDLAISALLFHNEGDGPGRLFTPAEWQLFLAEYQQHIQWTELEKTWWDDILLCAWVDEALWLLRDDDAGWAHPRQSHYLLSLLLTDLSIFALKYNNKGC